MSEKAAELNFQEEFDKAIEEDAVAAANPSSPASEEIAKLEHPSQEEQSAVETEEEVNVFGDLASEEANGEQSEEDSHEVTVSGETFNVGLDELKNGYQRHADYTRGKQEIAEMKKKHSNAITLWEALEGDYAGTVQKLMSRTGMQGQVAPQPDQDLEALVEQKLQEKLAADPRLQELENELSLRQIQTVFTGIEEEYNLPPLTNEDKQRVLEKAQEWETNDLSYVVYRLLQQQQKLTDAQKNVDLVSTTQSRRSGTQKDYVPEDKVYATVQEAWEASLAEEETRSL
jgi:hypothetical protein